MSTQGDVGQVDLRMAMIWQQRDVCGKPTAIREIDKLLDVRLLLTDPRPQYQRCSGCNEEALARPIRTTTGGIVIVIDCPHCDRSRCNECKTIVIDRNAPACPRCRAHLAFTPKR